jgi:UDP-glucuronate 4-epimerase
MNKRVWITGAAGFIGYHAAKALLAEGHEVLGLDNFNDYYEVSLKRWRQELLGAEIIEADILDRDRWEDRVKSFKPTHVLHLAAQAGVRYSLVNPQAYVRSNIDGFLVVLEWMRNHPDTKLVYASSSSVYGLNAQLPYSIKDRTDHQASFYGVTKKSNELMAAAFSHLYGFSTVGLRFFTVYGPFGRPDMALFGFTDKILKGEPIDLYNFGEMQRDFTYIDDIVAGTLAALDYQGKTEVFNLGNHAPVSLKRFVEVLEGALGKKAECRLMPLQPGDVLATYADITESSAELGFHPRVSLEQGVPRFVEWYGMYRKWVAKGGT